MTEKKNKDTKALFVEVDVQRDFMLADGALTVRPPEFVRENMRLLTNHAPVLIGSVDAHSVDAWEFNTNNKKGPNGEDPQFPPHCVKGTPGAERLHLRGDEVYVPVDMVSLPIQGFSNSVILEKEVYSLWANPFAINVVDWAQEKLDWTNTVVVFGVATDYCVKAAVNGFLNRGFKVIVAIDAVWGVTVDGHVDALDEMNDGGAVFFPTSYVFAKYIKNNKD